MAIEVSDRDRAGRAIYELLKIEVFNGNKSEAQALANKMANNLQLNNITGALILEENAYTNYAGVMHSVHAFQTKRFSGLIQLSRLGKLLECKRLIDFAAAELFCFITTYSNNNNITSSLSYSEAGKQLSLIGLNEAARVFLKKRVELCQCSLGAESDSTMIASIVQSLFDLYFTYPETSPSKEPDKIFSEIYSHVKKHPAVFSGGGQLTNNIQRLFFEQGIKWPV